VDSTFRPRITGGEAAKEFEEMVENRIEDTEET
jgi:hypothetical protein